MRPKQVRPVKPAGEQPSTRVARNKPLEPGDFDGVLEKLKLLEFGLFGLQQLGRNGALDAEDIGPFTRLAEEIESDALKLRQRLLAQGSPPSKG